MSDLPAQPPPNEESLKITALIGYGLFLVAFINGVTALAGVVLAYVMRGNATGTVWESHFRNLIHVFWISVILMAIIVAIVVEGFGGFFYVASASHEPAPALTGLLFLLIPAVCLILLVFAVWYLYRMIRGLIRALESKAY
jgi:uncharacterized membrane protein